MMLKRGTYLLLFVLMTGTSYAQRVKLDSIRWINKDLGHLYFSRGHVYFNFVGFDKQRNSYSVAKDTLLLTDVYTSSADNFKVKHRTNAKFLIRDLTNSRLYLKAIDSTAIALAGPDTYLFNNFKNSYDKDAKFSQIHFLSSTCRDECPQLEINILPNGDYHLRGGENAEPYKGEFTGKLSPRQLDTLNYWIKHSELKKMYNWQQADTVAGAPNYYLEISFENSKKKLSITTNQPPLNLTDLVLFLVSSYKKVQLAPVK
ncbi:DUF6438 domain-containing protein [Mucilaginibacter flavus]|uniref:DUF6438 domain-containing protein n=1 Tax=Mucilaginibacter flavus TaxID=931504 RepID=UPI0025B2EC1D|nr:DUF6438 domain-containing protein [Mucilaginibacter flavus]MDN3584850.1 DUF6438 domain-containing protein [Mucilaginibacter flavus]